MKELFIFIGISIVLIVLGICIVPKNPKFYKDIWGQTIDRDHTITLVLEKDYNKGDTLVIIVKQSTYFEPDE